MADAGSRTAAWRVREVRERQGLSADEVAAAMTKAGVPWDAHTLLKFEGGHRPGLDVKELFALAFVLSVPPIALLTDPGDATMALTPHVEVPTVYGLLWLLGEQPLHGMTGAWEQDTVAIRLARRLYDAMGRCTRANGLLLVIDELIETGSLDPGAAESRRLVLERELLAGLVALDCTIRDMALHGMPVPRLIDEELLVALARSRAITLDLKREAKSPAQAPRAASVRQ
jgi:transcriptional regulator with XRE-family HTH domain